MIPHLAPLKRFGQNFLVDQNIVKKIVEAIALSKAKNILEIGPGSGVLTFELAKRARHLTAVEVDRRFVEVLKNQIQGKRGVDIVLSDILKFDVKKYSRGKGFRSLTVVGNLPYYITTPILEYLFKNLRLFDHIFIMVQKEVADRLTAPVGSKDYSSLTCFTNYYCAPRVLFKIKKGSFRPVPAVDSSFLALEPKTDFQRGFKVADEKFFFKVIRTAFGQRRKMLYSSLVSLLSREALIKLPCQPLLERRAEELSAADFAVLSQCMVAQIRKDKRTLRLK